MSSFITLIVIMLVFILVTVHAHEDALQFDNVPFDEVIARAYEERQVEMDLMHEIMADFEREYPEKTEQVRFCLLTISNLSPSAFCADSRRLGCVKAR